MAVLAVAVMVVAMTPRTSSGPVALSATTIPITARAAIASPSTIPAPPASVSVQVRSRPAALLTSFAAFPHAVTSGPQLDLDGTDVADTAPGDDEIVFVRTEAVTYRMQWDDAQMIEAPDGSVIFDSHGDLVAHVADGDLISLVDD